MIRKYPTATPPSRQRSLFWRGLAAMLSWISERWLPAEQPLTVETLEHNWQEAVSWCRQFLADHDPGEQQFRGLPFPRSIGSRASHCQKVAPISYRGCQSNHAVSLPVHEQHTYTPWYQSLLRSWIARLPLADMDRYASTAERERMYRGHSF